MAGTYDKCIVMLLYFPGDIYDVVFKCDFILPEHIKAAWIYFEAVLLSHDHIDI